MARLHSATWCAATMAHRVDFLSVCWPRRNCGFDRGQEASFLTSVCFRCGSGHDAHKSILSGSTNFVDLLQARQRQTGSILRISFESWVTPPTIAQESQFCVALADATPALRDNDVMSMLRAVERGYGSMATASAATDTWKRMSNSHNALVHGDFHPGNLMLPRSSRAHLDEGAVYVLDFQRKWDCSAVLVCVGPFMSANCLQIGGGHLSPSKYYTGLRMPFRCTTSLHHRSGGWFSHTCVH